MNLIGMDQVEAIGYIKKLQMSPLKHKSLLDQNFLKSRDKKSEIVYNQKSKLLNRSRNQACLINKWG